MRLAVGARLGAYELRSIVGTGGMGEVYRARDSRLGREVAIKVLPETFAADPGRRQRFNREARAVSSLNHPHICTLHDIGSENGADYLVMELIEGESLEARLIGGALPMSEALKRAIEIADALSAAHRLGIVHRDLKPSNVMLAATGAKLLDFGVAVMQTAGDAEGVPTETAPLTEEGAIVGTLPYMAPEQLEGRGVDSRTDIFAFGALLYEMLTGRRAFVGNSRASVIAAILKEDPSPMKDGVIALPFGLGRVVRKCLAKDPEARWQTARDLRDELTWIAETAAAPDSRALSIADTSSQAARSRARTAWAIAAASIGLIAAVGWAWLRPSSSPAVAAEVRLDVATPPATSPTSLLSMALSPDGRKLAFVAAADGVDRLWVRALDSPVATVLRGTEGASYPFWKPDGQSLGFFANGMLNRIDLAGGAVQRLAPANAGRGGAWNRQGTIVFTPGNIDPLYRIPDTGGTPAPFTQSSGAQASHRFPQFLPDGEHVVFYVQATGASGLYTAALSDGEATRLVDSDTSAANAPGHLLFIRRGTLYAVRFDEERRAVDGEPFPVAESVTFIPGKGAFTASASGTVAYRGGGRLKDQLVWFDRSGMPARSILAPDEGGLFNPVVGADGRVLFQRTGDGNDIWLSGGAMGGLTRMTLDNTTEWCPVWSPGGRRFAFASNRSGTFDLYQKSLGGADEELLFKSTAMKIPTDWSRDGRYLLYRTQSETRSDLWVLPLAGGNAPFPLAETRFDEREGQFSPDGRWVAYQSDESGRYQIYLQPFPKSGERIPVTVDGGTQPRWKPDGRELFYLSPDEKLVAVPIVMNSNGQTPKVLAPITLFQTQISGGAAPGANRQQYDVSPDGQRFLMSISVVDANVQPISMVLNWTPTSSRTSPR